MQLTTDIASLAAPSTATMAVPATQDFHQLAVASENAIADQAAAAGKVPTNYKDCVSCAALSTPGLLACFPGPDVVAYAPYLASFGSGLVVACINVSDETAPCITRLVPG